MIKHIRQGTVQGTSVLVENPLELVQLDAVLKSRLKAAVPGGNAKGGGSR